jgi:hypothetical protein
MKQTNYSPTPKSNMSIGLINNPIQLKCSFTNIVDNIT